ncbi:MAG: hypothetical protein CVV64_03130 [Candidatus Wallbacteria bacterium HGW-Wallbacteria-1]|uniref:Transporter n=1 Tax=Candidatus Wallbacteria bacterium HGW-Wallbacteria-1 TaxID=2013854 RepID=A0A2N1PTK0_9BACT|nr:MAG: hypothetical protein CVV64_03130 [Candidatus Wallbacteria bacterium HGW-Wallbacteria-1]
MLLLFMPLVVFQLAMMPVMAVETETEGDDTWFMLPINGEGASTMPRDNFMIQTHVDISEYSNLIDPTPQFWLSGDEFKYKFRKITSVSEFRYGISEIVTLGARIRYADAEGTNALNPNGLSNANASMGDTDLFLKLRFPNFSTPTDMALTLGVEFPTGNIDETPVTGTGGVDMIMGLHLTSELHRGKIFGDLTYRFIRDYDVAANLRPEPRLQFADFMHVIDPRLANTVNQTVDPGSEVFWNVGYVYPFTPQFRLCGEVTGIRGMVSRINSVNIEHSDYNWVFISPGLQYSPDSDFTIEGNVMIPVSDSVPFDQSVYSVDPSTDYWYRLGMKWHIR